MATARPFAYNPGTTIPGTEQLGDLSIGVPTSGFTNNPQYWNGPDEELGYVIAIPVPDNSQPTPLSGVTASVGFYRSSSLNENSFVTLTNNVFGQNFTSGYDAQTWLTNNGYWTSYQSPLLVSLDAGNPSSYSGSGNTWYDLSGNNNDATLFNSPTYSSQYQGILSFDDASLEYATIPNIGNLTNWTVEAWFRLSSPLTGKVTSIVSNEFDLSNKLNYSIGTNNMPSNSNLTAGYYNGAWHNVTGVVPNVNTWYQVVGTYDGSTIRQYINGVASGGTLNYVGTPQSGGEVRLMRRWDSPLQSSNLVDGDLAIVKIYNTALDPSDILENYNNTYTRFIDSTPTPTPTSTVTPTPTLTPTPTSTQPIKTIYFGPNISSACLQNFYTINVTFDSSATTLCDTTTIYGNFGPYGLTGTIYCKESSSSSYRPFILDVSGNFATASGECSVCSTPTPTATQTPTYTPTPTSTPTPVTGYAFNLIATPYNFPSVGNSIMNGPGGATSGSTDINVLATGGRGFYFNSFDNDGIDRTSYFSTFTGQSVTITFSQTGSTAIYSGDTSSFKQWVQSPQGSGFVFGANIGVPPSGTPSGTAVLIQSASTLYNIGFPVYVSLVVN